MLEGAVTPLVERIVDLRVCNVDRDESDLPGQHDGCQDGQEPEIATRETDARKSIRAQRRRSHDANHDDAGDDQ